MMDTRRRRENDMREYISLVWLGGMKLAIVCVAIAAFVAGCAKDPLAGLQIAPPAPSLMAPARKFPVLKDGDDARGKLAEAAETHNREARRIRGLQKYIRTVRGE